LMDGWMDGWANLKTGIAVLSRKEDMAIYMLLSAD
jgi:hypothetical protein